MWKSTLYHTLPIELNLLNPEHSFKIPLENPAMGLLAEEELWEFSSTWLC